MDTQADAAGSEHVFVGGGEEGRAALAEARRLTLWQALSASAERLPDKVCLVGARDSGEIGRLTYRDLTTRVRAFSAGLASIGVKRGDRVVLWMTNSLDWIVASFAAMRLGAARWCRSTPSSSQPKSNM